MSGSLQGVQVTSREKGRISGGLDPCSPDMVDTLSHEFLILAPHGAVNMCFTEEGCELW